MAGAATEPAGVLLVDKAPGPSSHDIVERARAALETRRVGHTGTLDPFASGLLLLCVGGATRLAEYFHLPAKSYAATVRLGIETSTHDRTGEPVSSSEAWRDLGETELREALANATGRIRQRPPAFSAKRVDGRRAYELAREGDRPELPAVPVTVYALELRGFEPPTAEILATVSTGTYLRSLARDLGRRLGCGAHLMSLRRTAIGPFRVEAALPGDRLGEAGPRGEAGPAGGSGSWLAPRDALPWLPVRRVDAEEARRVSHGARIPEGKVSEAPWSGPLTGPGGETPLRDLPVLIVSGPRLLAVAESRDGALQPRKVLADP